MTADCSSRPRSGPNRAASGRRRRECRWRIAFVAGLLLPITATGSAQAARALTLNEAVATALASSPDLATAEHRVAAARAGLREAESAFYPQLRVSEAYSATDNPVQAFMMTLSQRDFSLDTDFNDPATTDNLETQVLATYSVFNGGSTLARRQAAALSVEAREWELDAARNDLVFEVRRAFHTVVKARRFVAAAEATVGSVEASVELARRRHEQGATLETDVLDAEVRLSQAREELVRTRSARSQAQTLFRQVLGVGDGDDVTAADVGGDAHGIASATTETSGGAEAGATGPQDVDLASGAGDDVHERAEWRAAQKAVAAAERRLRAAKGEHLPRVTGFAGYELDSGDASDFEDSWLAGVRLELDVFDGFRTASKVAGAEAELRVARAAQRRIELALQAEVEHAHVAVADARARLATTERAVEQAERSLAIVKDRYASGLALLTQVLDAESALTTARQRRIAAEADQRIALAALDKALGRGWEDR